MRGLGAVEVGRLRGSEDARRAGFFCEANGKK